MNLFNAAIRRCNLARPPVWFMRQAGRYHAHYQKLRSQYSFIDLCKRPDVACEVTMGPIDDFGFDAAIVFSDLLFPLEYVGMGLRYSPGPQLDWYLRTPADLSRLHSGVQCGVDPLPFQASALRMIRARLAPEKGLLGFLGGPLTLFCYAVEGSHKGSLNDARVGLTDGRYAGLNKHLVPLLVENMVGQAQAGADTVAIMDTCAGEFDPAIFRAHVVPALRELMEQFQARCPQTPITYYSKGTGPAHWDALSDLPIGCLGIDWHHDLVEVLRRYGGKWAIQGNVDPDWMLLDPAELEARLRAFFERVLALGPDTRKGWVCGLGHGVVPPTPEGNVRLFLKIQKEMFGAQS